MRPRNQICYYALFKCGLTIKYKGKKYFSGPGLHDLLSVRWMRSLIRYRLFSFWRQRYRIGDYHSNQYGEEYYFLSLTVNTPHSVYTFGCLREAIVKTIREFYKKDYDSYAGCSYYSDNSFALGDDSLPNVAYTREVSSCARVLLSYYRISD